MKKLLAGIILFLGNYFAVLGQEVFVSDKEEETKLDGQLSYFLDSAKTENIESIVSKKFTVADRTLNFGINDFSYWFKITLKSSVPVERILSINTGEPGIVEFYEQSGNQFIKSDLGANKPFKEREFLHRYYVKKLKIDSIPKTIFVKAYIFGNAIFPFSLKSETKFFRDDYFQQIISGVAVGTILVMVLYNFFLFVYIRDRAYLFYSLMIMSTILLDSHTKGMTFEFLWGAYPEWQKIAAKILVACGGIFTILFGIEFLQLRKYTPKIFKFLVFMVIANLAFLVSTLVFQTDISDKWSSLFAMPQMLLFLIVPFYCVRGGFKPAIYFFIAQFALLSGAFTATFRTFGMLEASLFTQNAFIIGAMAEVTLFSLGLAYRINIMREELKNKELEQVRLLQAEEVKRVTLVEEKNIELEHKVVQRTFELVEKNEEIQQQHEELKLTSEKLAQQHNLLEDLFSDMQASITYAQRIQEAIMPSREMLEKCFSDFFIFFRPRDIVSGDFYWASEIWSNGSKKQIFVVADCTGHGVPGAFMSLICANLLNQTVIERQIYESNEILAKLDAALRIFLNKDNNDNHDGMDCAVLVLDKNRKTLEFTGAKRPLWYCKENEFFEIKGDAKSIGGHEREKANFTKKTIIFDESMSFYAFSDGFPDQIGGEQMKKYMSKNFKELLKKIHQLPMREQLSVAQQTFDVWQGE